MERNFLVLIGRGPVRLSDVLGVGLLTASFIWAGFVTHPSAAFASATSEASSAPIAAHSITFDANGSSAPQQTDAATVGDFLRERNVNVGPHDYVYPASDVPVSDGLVIEYRAAVAVNVETAHQRIAVTSSAEDVGSLLEEENIRLGSDDRVTPALDDPVPANGTVRIVRVVTWERTQRVRVAPQTIHRLDFSMTPGSTRVIAAGATGEREEHVRLSQFDGGTVRREVVSSRVLRKSHPRIVADGVDEYDAFARFEARGVERTAYIAQSALEMVATAYTAACAGCSGITAIGRPAGHGIVAVDPSVIPLGTHLFIPGYGLAIAGDTGGAIHGYRIDLGFNSERAAMLFGRRQVTVYRLK
ncbi:MAG TPA: ubiquitin-like domain-containing protein [Candidatus Baltobacteraceae bacterium]|jgi:3D (Asp-Asp-Asp) domain-containing protein|nr:ubiquitin-like domain-containing protein [Candidatus Baltobacteraceae bacterium]